MTGTSKSCSPTCAKKKPVKPQVFIEGYRALPVPVKITTFRDKPHSVVLRPQQKKKFKEERSTVSYYPKPSSWNRYLKPVPSQSANKETALCRWYKKRKALCDFRKITKLEQQRLKALKYEKARREREAEFLKQLVQREKEIRLAEQQLAEIPAVSALPYIGQSILSNSKKKNRIKATEVNLCCPSDRIFCDNAKLYPKRSLNERLSNFFYKVCCQFFCCITFWMIIGMVVIFYY